MLKKLCPRCGKIIDAGQRYCPACQKYYDSKRKQRNKIYKVNRADIREQKFYKSAEWKHLKEYLLIKYKGLCLYSYYKENRIVNVNIYHHIIPVLDDWSMRLNVYNIIPLSYKAHRQVHLMYDSNDTNKKRMQEYLKSLINKWNNFER